MAQKPRIAIARICFGAFHHAAIADWLAHTCHKIVGDDRLGGLESFWIDKHGVCAARNHAVQMARYRECQYLVMLDADQLPDYLPGAPAWWDTAIAHALSLDDPCVIAAPTARADGAIVVYREIKRDDVIQLEFEDREYAAMATGIEKVAAISLAMSLIDMRCLDVLEAWRPNGNQVCPPFFRFGYTDNTESVMLFGEEIFTANLTECGVPIFVTWDCWAGHSKPIIHGKPLAKCGIKSLHRLV